MGFSVETSVSAVTVFLQGALSFFSPCVLPLVPLYVSYLAGGYAYGLRIMPGSYEFGKLAGAGHVGPLPYVGEAAALNVYGDGFQAADFQYAVIRLCGNGPRRCTFQGNSDGPDVLRSGTAAASGDVEQSFPGHGQHVGRHLLRGLVVGAHLVGQAGVGIAAYGAPGK